MTKKNQKFLNLINVISDAVLVFFSYLAAVYIRFYIFDGVYSIVMAGRQYLTVMAIYSAFIALAYYIAHVYESQRLKKMGGVIVKVTVINAIATLIFMAILYVLRIGDVSRWALVCFFTVATVVVVGKHTALRIVLHYYRAKGYNLRHIAIVGNGHLAKQYVEDIKKHPEYGYSIAGYFSKVEKEDLGKCLGSYESIGDYLALHELDEIVIALEPHEVQFMKFVLAAADKEGTKVTLIPFFNDYYPAHPSFEMIGNSKTINLRATPLDSIGMAMLKRAIDIVGSLIAIIITLIPMIIIAIGVKITSHGPIFFKQERVGLNKKKFQMLKFRSMKVNIDHNGWSTNDDDRKTKFGSFIRKFSLDELPQFFNVFIGQMSLVGPRPELPVFVSQFKEEIPLYLVRQQIRPGMTGWAQVNGLRGDTSIEERVKYDIWYIENWSIDLDIKILWMTVFGGMVNGEKIKK